MHQCTKIHQIIEIIWPASWTQECKGRHKVDRRTDRLKAARKIIHNSRWIYASVWTRSIWHNNEFLKSPLIGRNKCCLPKKNRFAKNLRFGKKRRKPNARKLCTIICNKCRSRPRNKYLSGSSKSSASQAVWMIGKKMLVLYIHQRIRKSEFFHSN